MKLILTIILIMLTNCSPEHFVRPEITLANLPDFQSDDYKVDPYINIAIQLQMSGKKKAIEQLKELSRLAKQDRQIIALCRMLFIAKDKCSFRGPMLGKAFYPGQTKETDWPLTPIEIVNGVPFKIVTGYLLGGVPESGLRYLEYCEENCEWNPVLYSAKSKREKQEALEMLIRSEKWEGIVPKVFLTKQIE